MDRASEAPKSRELQAPKWRGGPGRQRPNIKIPKVAELIAANIRTQIIRGELAEGDFLPPEGQLAEHFAASKPTMREAFRILETEQLISIKRGSRSGAKVHASTVAGVTRQAGFALQAKGTLLADVYLARLAVEIFAVRLAAERCTGRQLAGLRAELEKASQLYASHGGDRTFLIAVVRLHQSVVDVAGSDTLSMVSAMLQGVVEQHMSRFDSLRGGAGAPAASPSVPAGLRSFAKLFDLMEARDAAGAEAHWRAHMRNANARWLLGYDKTALVDVLD